MPFCLICTFSCFLLHLFARYFVSSFPIVNSVFFSQTFRSSFFGTLTLLPIYFHSLTLSFSYICFFSSFLSFILICLHLLCIYMYSSLLDTRTSTRPLLTPQKFVFSDFQQLSPLDSLSSPLSLLLSREIHFFQTNRSHCQLHLTAAYFPNKEFKPQLLESIREMKSRPGKLPSIQLFLNWPGVPVLILYDPTGFRSETSSLLSRPAVAHFSGERINLASFCIDPAHTSVSTKTDEISHSEQHLLLAIQKSLVHGHK